MMVSYQFQLQDQKRGNEKPACRDVCLKGEGETIKGNDESLTI